jgi:hypothetical protein
MATITTPLSNQAVEHASATSKRGPQWSLLFALLFCVLGFVFSVYLFTGERGQFELIDEMTHFMVARDVLRENAGVIFDAWGRPGNTLAYVFFSESLEVRRFATLVMSFLVVLFATGIGYHLRVRHLYFVPVLLWLQPWFFGYSFQSLTIVPFMVYLTGAIYFWVRRADLNERGLGLPDSKKPLGLLGHLRGNAWRWASLLIGMLPITRHEALPLLPLWIVYLYHYEIWAFTKTMLKEIRSGWFPAQTPLAEKPRFFSFILPYVPPRGKGYPSRTMLVLWTVLPYLLWNLGAAAVMGRLPVALLGTDQANSIYPNSNFLHYINPPWQNTIGFFPIWEGIGLVLTVLVPVMLVVAVLALVMNLRQRAQATTGGKSGGLASIIVFDDRYLWWIPFALYFVIHSVIIALPRNSLASGGYTYFVLPVSIMLAIFGAITLSWLLEKLARVTREGASVVTLAVIVLVSLLTLSGNIRPSLATGQPNRFDVVWEGSELRRTWNEFSSLMDTPPSWMQSDRIVSMSTLSRYELLNRGYEEQLCPLHLWNRPGNLQLYPNLLPAGTVVWFDNQEDSILQIRNFNMSDYTDSEDWRLLYSWPEPSTNWIRGMAFYQFGRSMPVQQPWLMAFQRTEANPVRGAEQYADYYCGEVELRQDLIVMRENVTLYAVDDTDVCYTANPGIRFPLLGYTYDRTQENAKYFLVTIPASDTDPARIAYAYAEPNADSVRASYDERLIQPVEFTDFQAVTPSADRVCQTLEEEN